MTFRFIHAADLHLDTPFKGLAGIPLTIRQRIVDATAIAFHRLIDTAIREKVDFVLFAGDIFDQSTRSLKAQLTLKKGLQRLDDAQIPSFIIHGNHDPDAGGHTPIDWPATTHFFGTDEVQSYPVIKQDREIARIHGISYASASVTENLAQRFRNDAPPDVFTIGLLHTNCGNDTEHGNYAPCTKQDLIEAQFDYWALGHVHQRRILHSSPPIVYPGNLQGRHIREQGEKGFYLVDVDASCQPALLFQPIQEVLWAERDIDVTDVVHMDEIATQIEQCCRETLEQGEGCPVILRVHLVGYTPLAGELAQRESIDTLQDHWNSQQLGDGSFCWIESLHFQGDWELERENVSSQQGIFSEVLDLVEKLQTDSSLREEFLQEACGELTSHYELRRHITPYSTQEQVDLLRKAERVVLSKLMEGER